MIQEYFVDIEYMLNSYDRYSSDDIVRYESGFYKKKFGFLSITGQYAARTKVPGMRW